MNQCNICTENFTERERAKLKCQYCDFESCIKCCKKYLLIENRAKCMNNECNREWTRQFLSEKFSKSFVNKEYKNHREIVLFNTERALMPVTQHLVENQIRQERILNEMTIIRNQIRDLNMDIYRLNNEYHTLGRRRNNNNRERALFIKACPDPDCRGFLSSQWKCGICEKWTCQHCNIVKGIDRDIVHECNPDDVSTATLINNDTKSCPSCGTGIFKIEGCDQMWCTQCNTGFNWRTNRIDTNVTHNPHYFEWLRRNGNEAQTRQGVEDCRVRIIDNAFIRHFTNGLNIRLSRQLIIQEQQHLIRRKSLDYCQNISHLREIQLPSYELNTPRINEDLRIAYMRNIITEEQFKIQIQKQDKKSQKYREIANVIRMVVDAVTDILYRFSEELLVNQTTIINLETLKEIDQMLEYANTCFTDISKTYNSKPLQFSETCRLQSV